MNKEIEDALHTLLHCSLKDTEYETQREQFEFIYKYIENLEEENQELKKQLEEKENIACNWKDSCLENAGKIEELENQQKEFIKYLEEEKDRLASVCSSICEDKFDEADDILQKYKEIIGDDNE